MSYRENRSDAVFGGPLEISQFSWPLYQNLVDFLQKTFTGNLLCRRAKGFKFAGKIDIASFQKPTHFKPSAKNSISYYVTAFPQRSVTMLAPTPLMFAYKVPFEQCTNGPRGVADRRTGVGSE